jgi:AcrR family transcriptional regulator
MDLFERQGYAGTTVEEIAAAAQISVRTLYRYFPSKEALIWSRFDPALQGILQAFRQRDRTGPPYQSLQDAMAVGADAVDEISDVLMHIWQLAADDPALAAASIQEILRWRESFMAEIAEQTGLPVHDRRVQLMAISLHAALSAGVAQWRGSGGRGRLADEVRRAIAELGDMARTATEAFEPNP